MIPTDRYYANVPEILKTVFKEHIVRKQIHSLVDLKMLQCGFQAPLEQ